MVRGLDIFRQWFAPFANQYVLIGGTAASLTMEEAGLPFRATKDLDIVLIVEALDSAFAERFWAFIEAGDYEVRERSEGDRIPYRFQKPKAEDFPAMLELFSRAPEGLSLAADSRLTPLPIDEAAASLSAILLDEAYYTFLKSMVRTAGGTETVAGRSVHQYVLREVRRQRALAGRNPRLGSGDGRQSGRGLYSIGAEFLLTRGTVAAA